MNVEYSDFYKFIVSLGLGMVAISVLTPWLFLREPFDLTITQQELESLTKIGREVMTERQRTVQLFIPLIPWFSGISLLSGLALAIVGSILWWCKTQKNVDQQRLIELELLKQKIKPASEEEVKANMQGEVGAEFETEETDFSEKLPSNADRRGSSVGEVVQSALTTERKVSSRIRSCVSETHNAFPEHKLDEVYLDLLLVSKKSSLKDYVVEFKYIRQGFGTGWLRESVIRTSYARQLYEKSTSRKAEGVVIIVVDNNEAVDDLVEVRDRAVSTGVIGDRNVNVTVLARSAISQISCEDVNRFLGG